MYDLVKLLLSSFYFVLLPFMVNKDEYVIVIHLLMALTYNALMCHS